MTVSESEGILSTHYRGPRRGTKKKSYEKIFEVIIVKNFPNMGKESFLSPGSPEIPIHNKPK